MGNDRQKIFCPAGTRRAIRTDSARQRSPRPVYRSPRFPMRSTLQVVVFACISMQLFRLSANADIPYGLLRFSADLVSHNRYYATLLLSGASDGSGLGWSASSKQAGGGGGCEYRCFHTRIYAPSP